MSSLTFASHPRRSSRPAGLVAALTAALLLGACSHGPSEQLSMAAAGQTQVKLPPPPDKFDTPEAAKLYWSTAAARNPKDERAAISLARLLKAEGDKEKARNILQQASIYNSDSRPIASEYGRLALDMGDLELAGKLLARAYDPARPDWRIVSAQGTLDAKQGNTAGARQKFEQALALKPGEPTVLNNLALAYALEGNPVKAEELLRQAESSGADSERVRQNLALVLGVQGKFDEAKHVAAAALPDDKVATNVAFLKDMVKATPVSLAASEPAPASVPATAWATTTDAETWGANVSTAAAN